MRISSRSVGPLWGLAVACVFAGPLCLQGVRDGKLLVSIGVDTESYGLKSVSFESLLGGIRTPLYPVFLRLCGGLGNGATIVALQTIIYAAMVWGIFKDLSDLCRSRWTAFAAVLPFATGGIYIDYKNSLLPELLAAAFSFRALFVMISRSHGGGRIKKECFAGLLVFLAILTKPQYLFLVPVSLVTLFLARRTRTAESVAEMRFNLVAGIGASVGPLLAYASLRCLLVGHFGLVSFGGANLAGIALNPLFFTQEFVDQIKDNELQSAAQDILSFRMHLLQQKRNNLSFKLHDTNLDPDQVLDAAQLSKLPLYDAVSVAYNANVWDVGRPALLLRYEEANIGEGLVNVKVDRVLSSISSAALRYNSRLYVHWLVFASVEAVNRVVRYDGVSARMVTLLCSIVIIASIAAIFDNLRRSSRIVRRYAMVTSASALVVCAAYPTKVLGLVSGVWGWIPGTIAPLLLPAGTVVAGLIFAGEYCLFSRIDAEVLRVQSQYEYMLACIALYFVGGVGLVIAVELPLDRYLMTVTPPLVSALVVLTSCLLRSMLSLSLAGRGEQSRVNG